MSDLRKKLDALVGGDESAYWEERVKFRMENKAWLYKSGRVSITVLHALDAQNITQKELAKRMGVSPQQISKILEGGENLTLQTITNLEAALDIELINITSAADLNAEGKTGKPRIRKLKQDKS